MLEIMVKEPLFFRSKENQQFIKNETTDQFEMPKQIYAGTSAESIDAVAESVEAAIQGSMSFTFLLNFFLSGSLSLLWGMINAM